MSAKDGSDVTIPSVFVSEFTGSLLKNVYWYNTGYFILINDLPFSNTHLLLPFAVVVGICFLVMLIFMVSQRDFSRCVLSPALCLFTNSRLQFGARSILNSTATSIGFLRETIPLPSNKLWFAMSWNVQLSLNEWISEFRKEKENWFELEYIMIIKK